MHLIVYFLLFIILPTYDGVYAGVYREFHKRHGHKEAWACPSRADCRYQSEDCQWSEWTGSPSCNKLCGGGQISRTRYVAKHALYHGLDCEGPSSETIICNTHACPAFLNVELTNDIKDTYDNKDSEGIYVLAPTKVNGKLNWLQEGGNFAIWYDDHGSWRLGYALPIAITPTQNINMLGNSISLIKTDTATALPYATPWKYYDSSTYGWTTSTDTSYVHVTLVEGQCVTWDPKSAEYAHAVSGFPCIFPFKYNGVTYSKCTTVGSDKPWCSTEVDGDQIHRSGKWGNCETACPKDSDE